LITIYFFYKKAIGSVCQAPVFFITTTMLLRWSDKKGIWQVRVFVTVYVWSPKACPRSVQQWLDRVPIIQLLVLVIGKQLDLSYLEQGEGKSLSS